MTKKPSSQTVLVTGASGFIGMQCVAQLLDQGYQVRGTLRNLSREAHLRQIFEQNIDDSNQLEFVIADLLEDEGWDHAVRGCEYVLHVASPFPFGSPKHEDDLINPAVEGTLRILKTCAKANVKRMVLTSSGVAINRGHEDYSKVYDESDWTNLEGDISAYVKSKTLAEKTAWDFIKNQNSEHQLELSVINPGLVMGPILDGEHLGTSANIIRHILSGNDTANFRNSVELVDVRDVASAHLAAMTNPIAAGKRYLCLADVLWWQELIEILDKEFASRDYRVVTQERPAPEDGSNLLYKVSNERIVQELGWQPRSAEEAIVAMGESLIMHKVV